MVSTFYTVITNVAFIADVGSETKTFSKELIKLT